jgi:hypothetical protein
MAAFIFSVFGAQPLCIAGVTGMGFVRCPYCLPIDWFSGPITVFNKTIFDILEGKPDSPNYLHFVGWVYFWSALMHLALAILNGARQCCHYGDTINTQLYCSLQLPAFRYSLLV